MRKKGTARPEPAARRCAARGALDEVGAGGTIHHWWRAAGHQSKARAARCGGDSAPAGRQTDGIRPAGCGHCARRQTFFRLHVAAVDDFGSCGSQHAAQGCGAAAAKRARASCEGVVQPDGLTSSARRPTMRMPRRSGSRAVVAAAAEPASSRAARARRQVAAPRRRRSGDASSADLQRGARRRSTWADGARRRRARARVRRAGARTRCARCTDDGDGSGPRRRGDESPRSDAAACTAYRAARAPADRAVVERRRCARPARRPGTPRRELGGAAACLIAVVGGTGGDGRWVRRHACGLAPPAPDASAPKESPPRRARGVFLADVACAAPPPGGGGGVGQPTRSGLRHTRGARWRPPITARGGARRVDAALRVVPDRDADADAAHPQRPRPRRRRRRARRRGRLRGSERRLQARAARASAKRRARPRLRRGRGRARRGPAGARCSYTAASRWAGASGCSTVALARRGRSRAQPTAASGSRAGTRSGRRLARAALDRALAPTRRALLAQPPPWADAAGGDAELIESLERSHRARGARAAALIATEARARPPARAAAREATRARARARRRGRTSRARARGAGKGGPAPPRCSRRRRAGRGRRATGCSHGAGAALDATRAARARARRRPRGSAARQRAASGPSGIALRPPPPPPEPLFSGTSPTSTWPSRSRRRRRCSSTSRRSRARRRARRRRVARARRPGARAVRAARRARPTRGARCAVPAAASAPTARPSPRTRTSSRSSAGASAARRPTAPTARAPTRTRATTTRPRPADRRARRRARARARRDERGIRDPAPWGGGGLPPGTRARRGQRRARRAGGRARHTSYTIAFARLLVPRRARALAAARCARAWRARRGLVFRRGPPSMYRSPPGSAARPALKWRRQRTPCAART